MHYLKKRFSLIELNVFIAGNLGSSLSQGTWVITSFGVANAISIPITGEVNHHATAHKVLQ